jgi:hypothetical protein
MGPEGQVDFDGPAEEPIASYERLAMVVGLDDVADSDKRFGCISAELRQRIGIVQALLNNPKLRIVDVALIGGFFRMNDYYAASRSWTSRIAAPRRCGIGPGR